jgi:hypothetical protein
MSSPSMNGLKSFLLGLTVLGAVLGDWGFNALPVESRPESLTSSQYIGEADVLLILVSISSQCVLLIRDFNTVGYTGNFARLNCRKRKTIVFDPVFVNVDRRRPRQQFFQ